MKLTLDELGRAYRGGKLRRDASCPSPELLARAASNEHSNGERELLLDHVAACSDCAEELRLALSTSSSASGAEVVPLRARRIPPRSAGIFLAAAAAILVAAGLVLQTRPSARPLPDAPFREDQQKAGIVSLMPKEKLLPRKAALLRWRGAPDNALYEITVATEDLTVLKKAGELKSPEYLVPPEVLAPLPPGARLVWQVVAFAPEGRRVGSRSFVNKLD